MANYYYFISSLPVLFFGGRPPFTFEHFLEMCRTQVSGADFEVLKQSSISGEYGPSDQPALRNWRAFDTALRNEIARLRSGHRHTDPRTYARGEYSFESGPHHLVAAAHRSASPIEGERLLDEGRWQALDEIAAGHFFDLDFLVVYCHKLLILRRWETMLVSNKKALLAQTLAR